MTKGKTTLKKSLRHGNVQERKALKKGKLPKGNSCFAHNMRILKSKEE